MAGRISFNMVVSPNVFRERSEATHGTAKRLDCFVASLLAMTVLNQVQGGDDEVDGLDADEWNDDAADAVDHQVAL